MMTRHAPLKFIPHPPAYLSLKLDVGTFVSWPLFDIYLDLGAQIDMELIKKGEHREDIENTVVHNALHGLSYFICSSCPPLNQ